MGRCLVSSQDDKQPLSLRISVTDRCQFRCEYCMPDEGVAVCKHEDILSFEEIVCFVQKLQADFEITKLRLTGGDPLVRRGIVDLVGMLSKLGIPDLALTTNAQRLAGMATALRDAGLKRLNISLDSLDASVFQKITRGGKLEDALAGIDAAIQADLLPIKLNMVVMRGVNDHEVADVLSFAMSKGCELRFLELMPVGYGASLFDEGFVSTEEVRTSLSTKFDLEPLAFECGSSSRRYSVTGSDGQNGFAGFISACSDPFCSGCIRLRLTSDGHLIGCLAREKGLQIRPLLSGDDASVLIDTVRQALQGKRSDEVFEQSGPMVGIGG
jgi:cyclic pyranopterin phosphate synthase